MVVDLGYRFVIWAYILLDFLLGLWFIHLDLFWVDFCFPFISVGLWLVRLLFGLIWAYYISWIWAGIFIKSYTGPDPFADTWLWYFFMFWHCVESGKSKIRAVGVVEAGYGHEQKVGGTWFEIKWSLAVWSRGGGKWRMALYWSLLFLYFLWVFIKRVEMFWGISTLCLGNFRELLSNGITL